MINLIKKNPNPTGIPLNYQKKKMWITWFDDCFTIEQFGTLRYVGATCTTTRSLNTILIHFVFH